MTGADEPRQAPTPSPAPQVSVVMPVHNAMPYLDAAIQSILGQTFADFEFVILDDASTDGSTERLRQWADRDSRIRLIESAINLGPAESSNRVALAAQCPIVARMDADDIAYPSRLEQQIELIRNHSDVGLVACLCDIIDRKGLKVREPETWRLSTNSGFVPFVHGAIMYRQSLFERVGGYRSECEFWEDQDLISRICAVSKVLVIPRALYQARHSTTSTRAVSNQKRLERAVDLAYRCVQRFEEDRSYDDLLSGRTTYSGKLDPRVFISLGSVVLWSGGRPRLFRRLLKRGRLSFDRWSIGVLVWTAWASVSPATLRPFLRFLLWMRQKGSSVGGIGSEPMRWLPGRLSGRDRQAQSRA